LESRNTACPATWWKRRCARYSRPATFTLKLNHAAGRDFTISDLRRQGFDAVLIAVGAHRSRDLSIPGVDLDGVHKGIDFLLNVNLGYKFTIGKKVIGSRPAT